MRSSKIILNVFLFMIVVSVLTINAQKTMELQAINKPKTIPDYPITDKRIKDTGWEIPKKEKFPIIRRYETDFQGFSISVTNFKPKSYLQTEYQDYVRKADNSVKLKSYDVLISGMESFEINGKTFAHKVFYSPYANPRADGSRALTGMSIPVFYYDEDGDGIFETLYPHKKTVDLIPDWVRK